MNRNRARPRGRALLGAALVAVAVAAAGCLPPAPPPPPPTSLSITTEPGLFPPFSTTVTDLVSRCGAGAQMTVSVEAPPGTRVSVDGQAFASGRFTATVSRQAGQSFTIVVLPRSRPATTHFVRCLPTDFPVWTATHPGATRAQYYLTNPLVGVANSYPTIFDTNGVPVWWGPKEPSILTTLLPDGNLGSVINGGINERALDGTLIRSVKAVAGPADAHDAILLPNGHVAMAAIALRAGVDLTAIGGPASASVRDAVIEEIDPSDGHVVWSWSAADHIPVTEMDPQWRPTYIVGASGAPPYDVYHWNSIEDTGSSFLLSFRHLDAIYEVDKATGNISWKLGGSTRPESLAVSADPVFTTGSHFGGQHDARLLPDGTVTLFDDGSGLGRPPRAVRYQIDEATRTATLLESVVDAQVTGAFCCGSARRIADGDWVIAWGGRDVGAGIGTESVGGAEHFALTLNGGIIYRLIPVPPGQLDRDELREGMDAQWSAGGAAAVEAQGAPERSSEQPIPFPP